MQIADLTLTPSLSVDKAGLEPFDAPDYEEALVESLRRRSSGFRPSSTSGKRSRRRVRRSRIRSRGAASGEG